MSISLGHLSHETFLLLNVAGNWRKVLTRSAEPLTALPVGLCRAPAPPPPPPLLAASGLSPRPVNGPPSSLLSPSPTPPPLLLCLSDRPQPGEAGRERAAAGGLRARRSLYSLLLNISKLLMVSRFALWQNAVELRLIIVQAAFLTNSFSTCIYVQAVQPHEHIYITYIQHGAASSAGRGPAAKLQ